MEATVLYGARDVRFEDRPEPTVIKPTNAVIPLPFTCICGSDLWPYRGIQPVSSPAAMGHAYCGFVEEVGRDVTSVKPGQFVIGSFFASDNTCPHCRHGYQTSCQRFEPVVGAQAPHMRVPLADGTLVATRDVPDTDMIPSLLALSEVMGTGWFAADAANVKPGATAVVVGDGAGGLLGVPHGVSLDGQQLFFSHVRLHGGPAPVRKYLPKLIDLVFNGTINPGKVFDLVLPLAQVAEGYRAMDERRAIKTLLQP